MKKIIVLIIALLVAMSLIACLDPENPNGNNNNKKIVEPLADLVDYGSVASYYNVPKREYSSSAKTSAEGKLQDKQDEENEKDIDDDTTTFTKIFRAADVSQIINRMAIAALPEEKMTALVNYIARADYSGKDYNFTKGKGSAIQDYEDLDYLYDLYDDENADYVDPDRDRNPNQETVDYNLQMKRRKVVGELVDIFGADGDQAARVAMEQLAYAQEVVIETMISDYNNTAEGINNPIPQDKDGFDEYFKEIFFDYDSLVYFKAFNRTIKTEDIQSKNYVPQDKKEIVQLYGYYYQYEKANYAVFNDKDYEDFTRLSQNDYQETNELAIKYAAYDRKQYAQGYRYEAQFYDKYYGAHFNFQTRQEDFDREVFGIGYAIPGDRGLTYSSEMKAGLKVGLSSTLVLSDINYEYTGENHRVTNYNAKSKAYNILSEGERNANINLIKEVELNVEQLRSQDYTINHSLVKEGTTYRHLSNALKYQIYSYSADYIRGIQSYKKDNVILEKEIERLDKTAANYEALKAEKEEKIGRNNAMLVNMDTNYRDASINTQLTKADEQHWDGVNANIKTAIEVNYSAYHTASIDGRPRHQVSAAMQVDEYFENVLIKRWWTKSGEERRPMDNPPSSHPESQGWRKEYDSDHALSRLLDTHETVARYMSGQIQVSYKEANHTKYITTYESGSQQDRILTSDPRVTINNTPQYTNLQTNTYETDETITLTYTPAAIVNNTPYAYSTPATEAAYNYYFVFEGWYVDTDLKYKAIQSETYSYDIALYPNYYIARVPKA
ncbi:MAG: hypothetical protein WC292_07255 [Clostridia bacterium]